MIEIARRLGRGHDFVRVDLYVVGDKIYFGELTHSPAAGTTPFEDRALDLELGALWKLPRPYRETVDAPLPGFSMPARELAH